MVKHLSPLLLLLVFHVGCSIRPSLIPDIHQRPAIQSPLQHGSLHMIAFSPYSVISRQDDASSLQDLDQGQEWEIDWQMDLNPAYQNFQQKDCPVIIQNPVKYSRRLQKLSTSASPSTKIYPGIATLIWWQKEGKTTQNLSIPLYTHISIYIWPTLKNVCLPCSYLPTKIFLLIFWEFFFYFVSNKHFFKIFKSCILIEERLQRLL